MAVVAAVLARGKLTDTLSTIFTATATTYITFWNFANVDAATQTVEIWQVTGATDLLIYSVADLAQYEHFEDDLRMVLESGDTLEAFSTDTDAVHYIITGGEDV